MSAPITHPAASNPNPSGATSIWYVAKGKDKIGPLSLSQLREGVTEGKFLLEQRYWCKGLDGWKKGHELPQIQQLFADAEADRLARAAAEPRWFVAVKSASGAKPQPDGPHSDNELVEQIASGALTEKTRVWRKGLTGWTHLSDVGELQGVLNKGLALAAQMVPPPLDDEPVPPTISLDEQIPAIPAIVARLAQQVQPDLAAPADPVVSIESTQQPLELAAQAVAQAVAKDERGAGVAQSLGPVSDGSKALADSVGKVLVSASRVFPSVRIDQERVAPVRELFDGLRIQYASRADVLHRLDVLQPQVEKDFMTGNGHALDVELEALLALVCAPTEKTLMRSSSLQ